MNISKLVTITTLSLTLTLSPTAVSLAASPAPLLQKLPDSNIHLTGSPYPTLTAPTITSPLPTPTPTSTPTQPPTPLANHQLYAAAPSANWQSIQPEKVLPGPAEGGTWKPYEHKSVWHRAPRTPQAKLILNPATEMNTEGLLRRDGYYIVALGTYYAKYIGQKGRITLDTGFTFPYIIGDWKADEHMDPTRRFERNPRKSVVEFVVDEQQIKKTIRTGNIDSIPRFRGRVAKVEVFPRR